MLQWFRQRLHRFLAPNQARQPKRAIPPRPPVILTLEQLEERLVPANNLLWVGGQGASWTATSGSWVNTATNQYATPGPNDNLTFDPSQKVMVMVDGVPTQVQGSNESVTDPNTTAIGNLTVASGYGGTISFQDFATQGYTNINGALNLAGGTLANAPGANASLVLAGSGTSNWTTGGVLNTTLSVGPYGQNSQSGATLAITSGTNPVVLGGYLRDYGTVNLSGAGIAENGGKISTGTYGVFNILSDASLTQQTGGAAPGAIDNQGTFEKTGGGGTSTVVNPFLNDGTSLGGNLLANSGTLAFTNADTSQNGYSSQTTLNGGSLTVPNYLLLGGWLGGVGTINGNVNNGDPTGQQQGAGVVHPGLANAAGTLNIVGNYFQSAAGTLAVNSTLIGPGPGVLNVQGNATLGGTFAETRDPNFTPPLNAQLPFLKVTGTVNGDFATKQYTNNSWSAGGQNNLYFDSVLAAAIYSLVVKQSQ
jgi:hypothetical protein